MNNIRFDLVEETVKAIKVNPEMAMTEWSSRIKWIDGVQNKIFIREFPALLVDEPNPLGGTDTAPNPVEYLLGALGSCFAITFEVFASQQGITLESVEVNVDAKLNAAVFLGLEEGDGGVLNPIVRLHAKANAPAEKIQEIAQMALLKSPVLASVKPKIELVVE